MQQQQFIDIIKQPSKIEQTHLSDLEVLINEYPFFESAHLLYTKGLHKLQSINYSKQLRKTAIVANSRSVLYELIHQQDIVPAQNTVEEVPVVKLEDVKVDETVEAEVTPKQQSGPVTVTNNDIKVIYINTVSNPTVTPEKLIKEEEITTQEIDIVKQIENDTEAPVQDFDVDKLNKDIEIEISKGIVQSYVQTDIIKTPELAKEEKVEPSSFTDWLKTIQKEAHTFQTESKKVEPEISKNLENEQKTVKIDKKSSVFDEKRQLIDKIIESDPGRIKLGTNKFFTPATDAKQSLLENEHLVTETLAKIYALQGNISKAIRAYEILSLKFPQKSVYFASLIEKLKTNK